MRVEAGGGDEETYDCIKRLYIFELQLFKKLLRKSWKSYSINRGLMLSQGVLPFPKCSTP